MADKRTAPVLAGVIVAILALCGPASVPIAKSTLSDADFRQRVIEKSIRGYRVSHPRPYLPSGTARDAAAAAYIPDQR